MLVFYIVIGIILLLFSVYSVIFAAVFLKKKKCTDITAVNMDDSSRFAGYREKILAGQKWIKAAPKAEIFITSFDGLRLRARHFENSGNKVFLLFHGYHSFGDNDFSLIVEYYLSKGFNVIMVDQRAHGKSEGKVITFGVKERLDCKAWIDYAIDRFGEECEIFLGGMSMGSSTVLMALGLDLPKNIKGVVADCGFTSPADIIESEVKRRKVPACLVMGPLDLMCRLYGGFSMYEVTTLSALKQNKIPVLLIHGDSDRLVPHTMSIKNYDVITAPKKLVLVNGADHGMGFLGDRKKVLSALEDFINNPKNIK